MRELLRRHHISFKTALAGIFWALKTQPNFRVHFIITLFVIAAGWYLGVNYIEMTILIFAIILGLSSEMINTSLESMTDLITLEHRQEAKIAKDVAAGMMLVVAIGTAVVGFLILAPYIIRMLG